MAMKVVGPLVAITQDAQLVYSSIAETVPAWSAGTAYNIGDQVRRDTTHKVYSCLIANTGADPATDTSSPPKWAEVGPTNRWAMFDQVTNSQSTDSGQIVVTIAPGKAISAMYLGGLKGATLQVVGMLPSTGRQIYDSGLIRLDSTQVNDWLKYFFAPYVQTAELVLQNLPPYGSAQYTVTLTGGGTVGIGALDVGMSTVYGDVKFNAQASFISYSRVDTDENTGVTTFVKKTGAKKNNYTVQVAKGDAQNVWNSLAALDAQLAVFIGTDDADLPMFLVRGFYKSATMVVPMPNWTLYDLELQGVT